MRRSLGITGLILVLVGLSLAPPLNLFLLWAALIASALAALATERSLPALTVSAAAGLVLFSPRTLEALTDERNADLAILTAVALLAPVLAIILNAAGLLGRRNGEVETYADVFERGW